MRCVPRGTAPFSAGYAASKAGAIAVAKSLRAELAGAAPHLGLVLLCPGVVKTNLIRTSAAHLPPGIEMADELIAGGHAFLNEAGLEPDKAVPWAMEALREHRFWTLPNPSDPSCAQLIEELHALGAAPAD